jgi:hypothetical protein
VQFVGNGRVDEMQDEHDGYDDDFGVVGLKLSSIPRDITRGYKVFGKSRQNASTEKGRHN